MNRVYVVENLPSFIKLVSPFRKPAFLIRFVVSLILVLAVKVEGDCHRCDYRGHHGHGSGVEHDAGRRRAPYLERAHARTGRGGMAHVPLSPSTPPPSKPPGTCIGRGAGGPRTGDDAAPGGAERGRGAHGRGFSFWARSEKTAQPAARNRHCSAAGSHPQAPRLNPPSNRPIRGSPVQARIRTWRRGV